MPSSDAESRGSIEMDGYKMLITLDEAIKELLPRFTYIKELGTGPFNRVIMARDLRLQRKLVAVKLIERGPWIKENWSNLGRRIINHASLMHPLVIGCYETFLTPNFFCMVTELAVGGSLPSFLNSQPGGRLTEHAARSFFQQTIIALEYTHIRGISIGNLDLNNLLLDSVPSLDPTVRSPYLKLSSSVVGFSGSAGTNPKIKARAQHNQTSEDILAAGVLLYVLLTGQVPSSSTMQQMDDGNHLNDDEFSNQRCLLDLGLSDEVKLLVLHMLHTDPTKRPTLDEIIQHSWLQRDLPAGAMQINEVWLNVAPRLDQYPLKEMPALLRSMLEQAQTVGKSRDPFVSLEFPCRYWLRKELEVFAQEEQNNNKAKGAGAFVDSRRLANPVAALSTRSSEFDHSVRMSVFDDEDNDGMGFSGENMPI